MTFNSWILLNLQWKLEAIYRKVSQWLYRKVSQWLLGKVRLRFLFIYSHGKV